MDGKINSESVSDEILIQNAKKKVEGSFMILVEDISMYPLFKLEPKVKVDPVSKAVYWVITGLLYGFHLLFLINGFMKI